MRHKLKKMALISCFAIALSGCGMTEKTVYVAYPPLDMQSESETAPDASYVEYDGNLKIEDGCLLPMLNYSDFRDPGYSNEYSDILRFCVYVETDHDTDNDGMADLVKAFVQLPKGAAIGNFKAATIYDPTPYSAGVTDPDERYIYYLEKEFNYKDLYRKGKKRKAVGEMGTVDAALLARPDHDWNYIIPNSEEIPYQYTSLYDYYLVRGYAIVQACGIGTYGSEGYELCGTDLERDSHKAVVEWLAGDRVAYTDKENNIEIKADWSNGNVAMTGISYGGTLSYEVATTGVKGLKTIIPCAGIASWYDYTNSQGINTRFSPAYKDYLAFMNCGASFKDDEWIVLDEGYRSWLWQVMTDEEKSNGNYAKIWEDKRWNEH